MSGLRRDIAYAARHMRQKPGFTAIVLITLALGIGANAALFTLVNGVLLRPLPFPDVDRLVDFSQDDAYGTVSEPEFVDYQRGMTAFRSLAAYSGQSKTIGATDEPIRTDGAIVSRDFFQVLGVQPEVGRTFSPNEFSPSSSERVMIVSHALWQQQLGRDPSIIGRNVQVDNEPVTIVGVMPANFNFPDAGAAFWVPWRMNPDSLWARNNHYLRLVGRLNPQASLAQAISQARTLETHWMQDYPDVYFPSHPLVGVLTPLRDHIFGAARAYLLALLGAVGFVLMIACVNVANLLLARSESRRKEFAVRTALGASRTQLVRQILAESALLALGGALLGVALAWFASRTLMPFAPSDVPRLDQVDVDYRVVFFTIGITALTALLFGLVPAWRCAREDPIDAIRDGNRVGGQPMTASTRHALVIAEMTLAVITLSASGLLVRSLIKLREIDLGFDPAHVLAVRLTLPPNAYSDTTADQVFRQIIGRIQRLPGVREAALDAAPPIVGSDNGWSILRDGRVVKTVAEAMVARPEQVTPSYFRAMSIPLRDGRLFTDADRMGAAPVVIINEALAKAGWAGTDPIGHTLKMFSGRSPWVTVVGVVGDVRARGYLGAVPATMYFPYSQSATSAYVMPKEAALIVRAVGDPLQLARSVRTAVQAEDPRIPLSDLSTMDQVVGGSIASRVFTTLLLAGFSALALLLAGIGIYGVIAYGVSQRTQEIGVRMALGASSCAVLEMTLREGARLVAAGLALGLLGAMLVDRLLRSMLVGVAAADIPTLAGVCVLLSAVAASACAIPAHRASSVSPTEALRSG